MLARGRESVVQARGLYVTTRMSRSTKGRSKCAVVYFTHFTQKESQSQRRSLVAAQDTPPDPTCQAWSSCRLLSRSLSEVLAGKTRNGPPSLNSTLFVLVQHSPPLFSFSFLSSHKTFSFVFTLSPKFSMGCRRGKRKIE